MSWDHGYFSQEAYTSGFYRETAPAWLDFTALVAGQRPPRRREGQPFRFLDLGCGTGFGLCLLAALHPEGSFVGVDFLPGHIAMATALAQELRLANLRFLEGDFLELSRDPTPLGSSAGGDPFDYVVSHGVATWIAEPVQTALFRLAARALRPGGLFYCSYNTQPGWSPLASLHELVRLERQGSHAHDPHGAVRAALARLEGLLGTESEPTLLGKAFPSLRHDLDHLHRADPRYLVQEYANDGWNPLPVARLHERLAQHKLTPVATATLPELFPVLLPPALAQPLATTTEPHQRETLLDLITFKSFRRDVFAKGPVALTRLQRQERLAQLRFRLQLAPSTDSYLFPSSFGELTGDTELYRAMEDALAAGPLAFEDWCATTDKQPEALLIVAAMLLHGGRVGLDRGAAGDTARPACLAVNAQLRERMLEACPYGFLTAPATGSAVSFTPLEALLAGVLEEGLEGDLLATCVLTAMDAIGLTLHDAEGQTVADPERRLACVLEAAEKFQQNRRPFLRSLGAIP